MRFIGGDGRDTPWVDRIRVMKGIFLFQKRGGAPGDINYSFRPYDYGPFTPEIYREIDALTNNGFVFSSPGGQAYRITDVGRRHLAGLVFPPDQDAELLGVRREVVELRFIDLLRMTEALTWGER